MHFTVKVRLSQGSLAQVIDVASCPEHLHQNILFYN